MTAVDRNNRLRVVRDGTPPPLHPEPEQQPVTPAPSRQPVRVTLRWVRWHAGELVAVTFPLLLAYAVTPWIAVLSVVAAALWGWHELQLSRSGTVRHE